MKLSLRRTLVLYNIIEQREVTKGNIVIARPPKQSPGIK